jgi:hypothetical protein
MDALTQPEPIDFSRRQRISGKQGPGDALDSVPIPADQIRASASKHRRTSKASKAVVNDADVVRRSSELVKLAVTPAMKPSPAE